MTTTDSTTPVLGFVGLGNMGRHMARRLAEAGHALCAYDINPAACAEAKSHGIAIAASVRDVAERAGTVLTSLPTPAVAREVIIGGDGLIAGAGARIVVDLSTVGPALAGEVADALAPRGKTLVDAPVSGGTTGAAAGSLAIMVAGPDQAIADVEPLLKTLGRSILRVGERAGQAQLAKLVNNMLFGANLIAALEAMTLGVKGGLDPRHLLDVLNASSGRSYITEQRIGPYVLNRDDGVRFAAGLLQKDVALGEREADGFGAKLFMFEAVGRFLSQAVEQGYAARDYAALIELFEKWNGVSVRASDKKDSQ